MNTEKNRIIRQLSQSESEKRLTGSIFEAHFENHICKKISERYDGVTISSGWIFAHNGIGTNIALKDISIYKDGTDDIFSSALKKMGWEVITFKFDQTALTPLTESNAHLAAFKRANRKLKELQSVDSDPAENDATEYLKKCSLETLTALWRSRMALNSLMFSNAYKSVSDIDALAHSEERGFSILEFKRKFPMDGFRPLPKDEDVLKVLSKSKNELFALFKSTKRVNGDHFGLDIHPHVMRWKKFRESKIRFLYLILNSKVRDPNFHLLPDLEPQRENMISWAYLSPNLFKGITSTSGPDSGEYSDKIRYQLTIPAHAFNRLSIPR